MSNFFDKKHCIVVTTINYPNKAMRSLAKGAQDKNWLFIVVGDEKSPNEFHLDGAEYLSLDNQLRSGFKISKLLPTGHYARKNIGYLQAIKLGVHVIIDTDDDNFPEKLFWEARKEQIRSSNIIGSGWINVLQAFTTDHIWPRGFPLNKILSEKIKIDEGYCEKKCCIQQGLVNGDADVDAIYRLISGKEAIFTSRQPITISDKQRCPFNSQNTTWFPDAWPFLYLPSYCSFRMTDIWRSFIAQSYLLRNGYDVSFHSPTVLQDRNAHNLMKDFEEEVPGYLNNEEIMRKLDNIPANFEAENFLKASYSMLIDFEIIGKNEMELLRAWIGDFNTLIKR